MFQTAIRGSLRRQESTMGLKVGLQDSRRERHSYEDSPGFLPPWSQFPNTTHVSKTDTRNYQPKQQQEHLLSHLEKSSSSSISFSSVNIMMMMMTNTSMDQQQQQQQEQQIHSQASRDYERDDPQEQEQQEQEHERLLVSAQESPFLTDLVVSASIACNRLVSNHCGVFTNYCDQQLQYEVLGTTSASPSIQTTSSSFFYDPQEIQAAKSSLFDEDNVVDSISER